MSGTSR